MLVAEYVRTYLSRNLDYQFCNAFNVICQMINRSIKCIYKRELMDDSHMHSVSINVNKSYNLNDICIWVYAAEGLAWPIRVSVRYNGLRELLISGDYVYQKAADARPFYEGMPEMPDMSRAVQPVDLDYFDEQ